MHRVLTKLGLEVWGWEVSANCSEYRSPLHVLSAPSKSESRLPPVERRLDVAARLPVLAMKSAGIEGFAMKSAGSESFTGESVIHRLYFAMDFDHEDKFVEKLLRWMHDFVATKNSIAVISLREPFAMLL